MSDFVDNYKDIYDFTKDKIEQELQTIIEYFYAEPEQFNVNSVDIVEEALNYQEKKEKLFT